MKAGTRWFAVFVAAVAWMAACVITWQMPVATRVAVSLTGATVLLIVAIKAAQS